jgi:hypothetical protein
VIVEGFWIVNWIYWKLTDPWLAVSLIHTLFSSLQHTLTPSQPAVSLPVFVWQRLPTADVPPSSGFPNCPRASATSFSQQQLTTTERQQFSSSHIHSPTDSTPLTDSSLTCPAYTISTRTAQKTSFLRCHANFAFVFVGVPTSSLLGYCLATAVV